MFRHVLTWWFQQLLELAPSRLRAPWRGRDGIIAEVSPSGEILLARQRSQRLSTVPNQPIDIAGADAVRSGPVILRLRAGALLQREVELPLAAERDLTQVLRYEMDRLTPFGADELYWDWRLLRRDRARGRLKALLLLVPRQAVDSILDTLRRTNVVPTALEAADGAYSIPLATSDSRRETRRRRILTVSTIACAALAITAVIVPFVQQTFASHRIERRIAALRPQVNQVDALRRRIAGGAAGANVIAAQQAESGDPLTVLAIVTDALPDDTYLRELTLHGRVLTLSGQSAAAAKLIPALAGTLALRDLAFAAPVTRNETTQAELFSIRALVAP